MAAPARFAQIVEFTRSGVVALALLALAGCDIAAVQPAPKPAALPSGLADPDADQLPSGQSLALQKYYARVQNDMLVRGLLRHDGGGPDTPFSADDLADNFEQIAFYDEYVRGAGLIRGKDTQSRLRRWGGPVRMAAIFGDSVSPEQRARDTMEVRAYAARLARITGHPISYSQNNPNFHIFFLSEDDRPAAIPQITRIVPGISDNSLDIFRDVPRSIHCLVAAFSQSGNDQNYTTAIALIRTEHPDLLRRSCIHEELAQGLGLANDSPQARPSIFNDDDEFALLTSHDELLLQMLYDPRLRQGMSAQDAAPIARIIAREIMGEEL